VIVVVDYGVGNLGSIVNMLRRIGCDAGATTEAAAVAAADRLILPGVGAFDPAMERLRASDLLEPLRRRVIEQGRPLLGICLGMQLLTEGSEEGQLPGLGWLPATTVRFRFDDRSRDLRVPHMGWNTVTWRHGDPLGRAAEDDVRYYFAHSYHVRCRHDEHVLATTEYGGEFHSAVRRDNIRGTQFHPEKSHRYGMDLLRAFAEL
jgi:glutamine amidotransferase